MILNFAKLVVSSSLASLIHISYHNKMTLPASPTGLHVVRTGFSSYGRGQTLYLSRAETDVPIDSKFWTNDYVGQIKRIAKFRGDRFCGSGSPCGWNIQFQILGFFFFFLLVFCFLIFFLFRQLAYRPQFATDFDAWWLNWRGLA